VSPNKRHIPTKNAKNTRRLEKAVHGKESVFSQKLAAEVVDGDCEPIFNSHHTSQHLTNIHKDETFFNYAICFHQLPKG